jgi:hypothetical protein
MKEKTIKVKEIDTRPIKDTSLYRPLFLNMDEISEREKIIFKRKGEIERGFN